MMKKFKYIFCLGLLGFGTLACSDLLDTEPRQSVSVEGALQAPDVLQALLTDVYSAYQGAGRLGSNLLVLPEVMADNFRRNQNRGTFAAQWQNTQGAHMGIWANYSSMLNLNVVLAGSAVLTPRTIGEAHALRALSYLHLASIYAYFPTAIIEERNFGSVPIITDAVLSLQDITLPARAPINEVYDLILSDVDNAISRLDNVGTRARFTRVGAQALGARAALYAGRWQKAIDYAEAALASGVGTFSTRANYVNHWYASVHPEALWYLEYQANENQGPNTSPQSIYVSGPTVPVPNYIGNGDFTPNQAVMNLLAPTDVRRGIMIPVPIAGRANALGTIEMHKFNGSGGEGNRDNIAVFRISELYLTLAEAYAQLGQTAKAQENLQIMKRRNVDPTFVVTATGDALINEILTERRLELIGEGHRFFDLKRYGRPIDKSATDMTGEVILFNDLRILAPLPSGDLELNPNLVQNFGY